MFPNNNDMYIYIYISSPSSGYPLSSINGTSNGHMSLLFSEGFLSKSQLYVEPTKTKRRVPRYLTSNLRIYRCHVLAHVFVFVLIYMYS